MPHLNFSQQLENKKSIKISSTNFHEASTIQNIKVLYAFILIFFVFDISKEKSKLRKRNHCIEQDRDKMSLADFIYYLPESNPMK